MEVKNTCVRKAENVPAYTLLAFLFLLLSSSSLLFRESSCSCCKLKIHAFEKQRMYQLTPCSRSCFCCYRRRRCSLEKVLVAVVS
jgi:hypothetical protein